MKKTYLATAVAALFVSPITTAIAADTLLDDVVVSSSRSEQRSFDAPGSIQSVNRSQIENGGPQINLSESLAAIPGINAANRNNYAQDLQVSIRGFGARAPFGVRGVKMFIDGLPASLADGQGQTSQFAITSADRIEVLRGPISSLYGNASGGVLQVFTRNPSEQPELIVADTFGSYGLNHKNIQYSEKRGDIGIVVDSSNFKSDGFRQYSAVEREHLNAKFVIETERGKASIITNYLDNKYAQEPGSLTADQYRDTPYMAQSANITGKYGKSFTQGIYGLVFDGKINSDTSYSYRLYSGNRKLDNPGGAYFVIDRKIHGGAASISTNSIVANTPVKLTAGIEYDYYKDYRLGYSNSNGNKGQQTRDEDNIASSYGGYIQSEWLLSEKYTGLLGLRYSSIKIEVNDFWPVTTTPSNPDSSGSKTFNGISPVVGLTHHLNQQTNIYAQIGRGFESPTMNELLYKIKADGTSFENKYDYSVGAAKSLQSEVGLKWRDQNRATLDLSAFHIKTKDDILPRVSRTTGSTWLNADTEKYGLELSGLKVLPYNFAMRGALTLITAKYSESAGSAVKGGKIPGIPQSQIYLDLSWRSNGWLNKSKMTYTEAGIDYRSVGKSYANSDNSELASAYQLFGLKVSHNIKYGSHSLSLFGRLDNIFDKKYVSSVVVNQEERKYYEPGMPRNWIVGVKYSLAMN
jgi:iron complex outermembrane recepter protein